MPARISHFADVHPDARLGINVEIGPFCRIGPEVVVGDETVLESHVVLSGKTTLGRANYCHPHVVIGGPPQDVSYSCGDTSVEIGNNNVFREGVTVNRGANKEDGTTRIEHNNLLMSNAHVAHNCHLRSHIILVNGVLLGGHVHVHDWAIVSGNSVVHHFSTLGTLSFVSGGCRVPHDIAPYMLAAGSDNPTIKTVNIVGLRRRGVSEQTITSLKLAHRLLFRQNRRLNEVRSELESVHAGPLPTEVQHLLSFVESQQRGKLGRAREASRDSNTKSSQHHEQDKGKGKAA